MTGDGMDEDAVPSAGRGTVTGSIRPASCGPPHTQQPLMGIVPDPQPGNVREREAETLARIAEVERAEALTLPPESELRAHLLRDATRLACASAQELGFARRPEPLGQQAG